MSGSIKWIQQLQAISQAGLAYTKDAFDRQRFESIQSLAAEMLADLGGLSTQRANEIFYEDKGYRTPKIDVRGAIFDQEKILLVKERSDGLWTLPGGWADINETPSEAVIREVFEETGLRAAATKLAAVHDINSHQPKQFYHTYKLFFMCRKESGELCDTDETTDARYFSELELPELSTRRTTLGQLSILFKHMRNPALATEFD